MMDPNPNVFHRNTPIDTPSTSAIRVVDSMTESTPLLDQLLVDIECGVIALEDLTLERLAVLDVIPRSAIDRIKLLLLISTTVDSTVEEDEQEGTEGDTAPGVEDVQDRECISNED